MRASSKFYLFSLSCIYLLAYAASCLGQEKYCETGIFVNPSQIQRAQSRFITPDWNENAVRLQRRITAFIKQAPRPYISNSSTGFFTAGRRDFVAAVDLALYGVIGNDADLRQASLNKSKEILLAWARETVIEGQLSMERPPTREGRNDYAGLGLYVGQIAIGAVHAFQLLRCSGEMNDSEANVTKQWFRRMGSAILEGRKRWEDNNYFGQRANNHLSTHNAAIYAIGVALDDRRLRDWALNSPENKSNFMVMLDLVIYNGSEPVPSGLDQAGSIPSRGEIYDRYRMVEEKKGLNYAFVHLLQLTMLAEAAANQGTDLYKSRGRNGETLRDAFAYYGEFLAKIPCSTEKEPEVTQGPPGFQYYLGAKVEPNFWIWVLPLMTRYSADKPVSDITARIKSNNCRTPVVPYSPEPFNTFTN